MQLQVSKQNSEVIRRMQELLIENDLDVSHVFGELESLAKSADLKLGLALAIVFGLPDRVNEGEIIQTQIPTILFL